MVNAFTIDLEDWFCSVNMHPLMAEESWDGCELRVVESTRNLLNLLRSHRIRGTVFVLGWIAEKVPFLIKEIEQDGHEIGTHGYSHAPITRLTESTFRQDLERALAVTQRLVGQRIIGFRAPSFTITKRTLWALEIIKEHGLLYDSSVYPFGMHPDYGLPGSPLTPYRCRNSVIEVPLACAELMGVRVPCAGGAYFRLYPYRLFRWLLRSCNQNGRPAVFYIHPWEIDPGQSRQPLPVFKAFRHYVNLHRTLGRLRRLLADFEFTSVRELLRLRGFRFDG